MEPARMNKGIKAKKKNKPGPAETLQIEDLAEVAMRNLPAIKSNEAKQTDVVDKATQKMLGQKIYVTQQIIISRQPRAADKIRG